MYLITNGDAIGVTRIMKKSPENDFNKFRYKMKNRDGETIFVSPIALVVNVGDYTMLDTMLKYL